MMNSTVLKSIFIGIFFFPFFVFGQEEPVEVGVGVLAKKEVYFDFGKADLRPEDRNIQGQTHQNLSPLIINCL